MAIYCQDCAVTIYRVLEKDLVNRSHNYRCDTLNSQFYTEKMNYFQAKCKLQSQLDESIYNNDTFNI